MGFHLKTSRLGRAKSYCVDERADTIHWVPLHFYIFLFFTLHHHRSLSIKAYVYKFDALCVYKIEQPTKGASAQANEPH